LPSDVQCIFECDGVIWTIFPSIILRFIFVIPSFVLLCSMDKVVDPTINMKIIGHQSYWSMLSHENDGNATKWTKLILWSIKLLAYWKKKQKHFQSIGQFMCLWLILKLQHNNNICIYTILKKIHLIFIFLSVTFKHICVCILV